MNSEEILVEYLKSYCLGEEQATTDRNLRNTIGIGGTVLREMVNGLRRRGVPICSSERGYYYAETAQDIVKTINHLEGRVYSVNRAVLGLSEALARYEDDEI